MHKIFIFICIIALSVITACACTGCATTAGTVSNRTVLEHQKRLDEYQNSVSYYLGRIDAGAERLSNIRGRAESMGAEIDRIIELFDEYQRAVEQLINDYNKLRDTIKYKEETVSAIDYISDNLKPDSSSIVIPIIKENAFSYWNTWQSD